MHTRLEHSIALSITLLIAGSVGLTNAHQRAQAKAPIADRGTTRTRLIAQGAGGITPEKIKTVVEIKLRQNWKPISGPEGPITKVAFSILGNGQVGNVSIANSAGNTSFDQSCVTAINGVGPFPALPAYFQRKELPMVATFHAGPRPSLDLELSSQSAPGPSVSSSTSSQPTETPEVAVDPSSTEAATRSIEQQLAAMAGQSGQTLEMSAGTATPLQSTGSQTVAPATHSTAGTSQSRPAGNLNKHVHTLNNQAIVALNDSNFEVAIQKLEEALKIDPSFETGKQNLAIAYNNYGLQLRSQPPVAIKIFHKAMAIDPGNEKTKQNLDAIIGLMGKNPASFADRVQLGDEAARSGDKVGAKIEYETALSMKPDPAVKNKLAQLSGSAAAPPAVSKQPAPTKQTMSAKGKTGGQSPPPPAKTSSNAAPKTNSKNPTSKPSTKPSTPVATKGGAPTAPVGQKLNTIYRNLNSLEQKTFAKTYQNDDILTRIGRLEQKLLGKVQSGQPLRRIDALLLCQ